MCALPKQLFESEGEVEDRGEVRAYDVRLSFRVKLVQGMNDKGKSDVEDEG